MGMLQSLTNDREALQPPSTRSAQQPVTQGVSPLGDVVQVGSMGQRRRA